MRGRPGPASHGPLREPFLQGRASPAGECGAVGGLEVLPFGLLVFVVGALIVANAWAVIDAKMAVTAAAREAVRAAVEAPAGGDIVGVATVAATAALTAHGRSAGRADIDVAGALVRCDRITAVVRYRLPAIGLAWVGRASGFTATATATEVVDPLRSGLAGEATCVR